MMMQMAYFSILHWVSCMQLCSLEFLTLRLCAKQNKS